MLCSLEFNHSLLGKAFEDLKHRPIRDEELTGAAVLMQKFKGKSAWFCHVPRSQKDTKESPATKLLAQLAATREDDFDPESP